MTKLQALPLAQLQKRRSAKWREFPQDILPLPVAEMDFEIAKPIRDVLAEMINNSDTGYLGPNPELAINLAKFAKARWGWQIDTEQVFIATDVGVGMVEMARTIVNPGDLIMINSPVYHNMNNWIAELKCKSYDAPLIKNDLHYTIDLDAIERGYATGVKAHFLCSPHNPVGTVFSRDELAAIADLAKKYGVTIFSDEIHAPLTYKAEHFTPFLAVSDAAREVGICVTSASKSWNLAGLKCATIITAHPKQLELAKSMPMSVHHRASLFGAVASAAAYECADWLDDAIETLDGNRKFLKNLLAQNLPSVNYRIPDFSYLAWLDLESLNLAPSPAEVLLEKGKLALNPGILFGPESGNFVRLNFATSEEILVEAVSRIASCLKG
jgi:cystathionine beta-lyase